MGALFVTTLLGYLALLYAQLVTPLRVPAPVLGGLGALCCLAGLLAGRRRGPKLFAVGILGVGLLLHWTAGTQPADLVAAFRRMGPVLPLIALLPVAGMLFGYRDYGPAMLALAAPRLRSGRALHGAFWLVTHLVSAVVTMGALPVIYALVGRRAAGDRAAQRFVSTALLRGYTASAFWTPAGTAIAIGTDFTGARYGDVLPVGLALALLAGAVNAVSGGGEFPALSGALPPGSGRRAGECFLVLALFVGLVVVLQPLTGLGLIALSPLVGVLFTVAGFLSFGAAGRLGSEVTAYVSRGLPPKSSEIALVLAVGFFTEGVEAAPLTRQLIGGLQNSLTLSPHLAVFALSAAVIVLGFLGITPTVGLLFTTSLLEASTLGVPPSLVVAALAVGQVVGLAVTPVALPLFILAGLTGLDPVTVGTRWNWRHGALLFAAAQALLQALVWLRPALGH